MYEMKVERLDERTMTLKLPESLKEITFEQLVDAQGQDLSDSDIIGILSGVSSANLKEIRNRSVFNYDANVFIKGFNAGINREDINITPNKLNIKYEQFKKTVYLDKYVTIQPIGAFCQADKAINDDFIPHTDKYGDLNIDIVTFRPSLEKARIVVNAFLYCQVTGYDWDPENDFDFASGMTAFDVLSVSKYFYNFLHAKLPKPTKMYKIKSLFRKLTA
jgi:hypothetical protein